MLCAKRHRKNRNSLSTATFFFRAHMEPTKSRKSLLHFHSQTNYACSYLVVTLFGTSGTANFGECRSYFIFAISCCYLDSWALHEQSGSGYSRINFSQTVIGHLGPSQVTESMKCSFTCSNFERDTLQVVKLGSGVPCVPSRFVVLCTSLKTAKNDLKLGFVFVVQRKINELCSTFLFVHVYSA